MLGISRAFLYILRDQGRIRMIKLGRAARVTANELNRFIAEEEERNGRA